MTAASSSRALSLHTVPVIQVDLPKEHRARPRRPTPAPPPPPPPIISLQRPPPSPSDQSNTSEPMPIPNARDPVPPPLPPPRLIADPDLALRYARARDDGQKTLPPIRPGSSLLIGRSSADIVVHHARRSGLLSRPRRTPPSIERQEDPMPSPDDGEASVSSTGSSIPNGSRLKVQEPSLDGGGSWTDSYDKSLLEKLNPGPSDGPTTLFHPTTTTTTTTTGRRRRLSRPGLSTITVDPHSQRPSRARSDVHDHDTRPWSEYLPSPDPASGPGRGGGGGGRRPPGPSADAPALALPGLQQTSAAFLPPPFLSPRLARLTTHHRPTGPGRSALPDRQPSYPDTNGARDRSRSGSLLTWPGEMPDAGAHLSPTTVVVDDHMIDPDPDPDSSEETQMRRLRLAEPDRTPPRCPRPSSPPAPTAAGQKRRASSPPRVGDEQASWSARSDERFHRRSSAYLPGQRTSPSHRFPIGSLSSAASSSSFPHTGSTVSSTAMTLTTNSLTSISSSSYDRTSPGGTSPASDLGSASPYVQSLSLDPSPRASVSAVHHHHHHHHHGATSEVKSSTPARTLAPDEVGPVNAPTSLARRSAVYFCDCCPKKPKRFETSEELRMHQTEKQYTCQYCNNRFKNKNEAERHQNSLHLRRHSWSCAALLGYRSAFHPSTYKSAPATDVCGFCGKDFPCPADWEVRVDHLNNDHKFRACNQAKKFFRADHFRQHLKHSHAGTSGKWTNMLENACMKDEPPPRPSSSTISDRPGSIGE